MQGVQTFGLLRSTREPVETILEALPHLGCTAVEPCICAEPIQGLERMAWPPDMIPHMAEVIRKNGMCIPSCHVFVRSVAAEADWLRTLAETYGIEYFVVKSPEDLSESSLRLAAEELRAAAEKLGDSARILIHNEQADISRTYHGKTACEVLADLAGDRIGLEVDVGWVMAGGMDPDTFVQRNLERIRALHLKDFVRSGDAWTEVSIGLGQVQAAAFADLAERLNIPVLADQDRFGENALEELAQVFRRIRKTGKEHTS